MADRTNKSIKSIKDRKQGLKVKQIKKQSTKKTDKSKSKTSKLKTKPTEIETIESKPIETTKKKKRCWAVRSCFSWCFRKKRKGSRNGLNAISDVFFYTLRHPFTRLLVLAILFPADYFAYTEDPITYSQKPTSVPILGLAVNQAFLSYVQPTDFPKYFSFQLIANVIACVLAFWIGEILIRICLLQKLFNLRGFKDDKGKWLLGLVWIILGLWLLAVSVNFIASDKKYHTLEGFFDYVIDNTGYEESENSMNNGSNYNTSKTTPTSFSTNNSNDIAFKFLKFLGVIDFGLSDVNSNKLQEVKYLTNLVVQSNLPMSNELFCLIARAFVFIGGCFTIFSIIDMMMQDMTYYPLCCHKAKSSGCWDNVRIPLFWIFISIVITIASINLYLSVSWTINWKGTYLEEPCVRLTEESTSYVLNSSIVDEYSKDILNQKGVIHTDAVFYSKDKVILALDNEGQQAADRYLLYDKMNFKKNEPIVTYNHSDVGYSKYKDHGHVTSLFTDLMWIQRSDSNVSETYLNYWLQPDQLMDQKLIGSYTGNLMNMYQDNLLVDLLSLSANNQLLSTNVDKSSENLFNVAPLASLHQFQPTTTKPKSPLNNRGFFDTAEVQRIWIKALVVVLEVLVLIQDPAFPHFEDDKKDLKRAKRRIQELGRNQGMSKEALDEFFPPPPPLKLVGIEGNQLNIRTIKDTLTRLFCCKSGKSNNKTPIEFLDEDDVKDMDFFASSESSEEEEVNGIKQSFSKDFSCKNCCGNGKMAILSCLGCVGCIRTDEEASTPHLSSFGGEQNRYYFNRNACARICCSCCNKKSNKQEEVRKIRAKNLCKRKWKNWCCCFSVKSSVPKQEYEIKNVKPKTKMSQSNKPLVTVRWVAYSVFFYIVLLNILDLSQQINYDPTSYNQVVDVEGRIHSVYVPFLNEMNPELHICKSHYYSALHVMSPSLVNVATKNKQNDNSIFQLWTSDKSSETTTNKAQENNTNNLDLIYYSSVYGYEPFVKYTSKLAAWNIRDFELESLYEELIIGDGAIEDDPMGVDYALEVLLNFINHPMNIDNATNPDNNHYLEMLQQSVSKRIDWKLIYDKTNKISYSPESFYLNNLGQIGCNSRHSSFLNVNATNEEQNQIVYKLYGVSCKCWKFVGLRSKYQGIFETMDGIYAEDFDYGKPTQNLYPLWENTTVKTLDNFLSLMKFQFIGSNDSKYEDFKSSENPFNLDNSGKIERMNRNSFPTSNSYKTLGTIQSCLIANEEEDRKKKRDLNDQNFEFFATPEEDFKSSHVHQASSASCSSLEIHTLFIKKAVLLKMISKSQEIEKGTKSFCVRPFLDDKWLEHCHLYREDIDVRCGPCYEADLERNPFLFEQTTQTNNEDSLIEQSNAIDDYVYTTVKKRLSFVVDVKTGEEDFRWNDSPQPTNEKDLGFWFGGKDLTLRIADGYIPSSDQAYVDEELPVMLTQKFKPVLTFGPLNCRFEFIPYSEKVWLGLMSILVVVLVSLKISISFIYRALKKWEHKLKRRMYYTKIGFNRSVDQNSDVIQLEETAFDVSELELKIGPPKNSLYCIPKLKLYGCKLRLLFCCKKWHRSRKDYIKQNEFEEYEQICKMVKETDALYERTNSLKRNNLFGKCCNLCKCRCCKRSKSKYEVL